MINALTDDYHPCQLLADVMTWTELRGSVKGRTAVWIGDGNNMCHSWINAARQFDFHLRICCRKATSRARISSRPPMTGPASFATLPKR